MKPHRLLTSLAALATGAVLTACTTAGSGVTTGASNDILARLIGPKMSERMGVSVEWLQKMEFAANQSGASIDDISTAMRPAESPMDCR